MTLNKVLIGALCALSLGFTACSDDDDDNRSEFDGLEEYEGAFVINQGNMNNNIPGSITNIDYKDGEAYQNVFKTVNGRVLGDTPQSAIIHGDKMYVAVYKSNIIEILDSKTLKSIKTISLSGEGSEPRYFAAKGDKVYVSLYDGYVGRIDTKSLELEAKVKVGPNPETIAIGGNYLYVPNSDGMNYQNGYADGKTVSVINLSSFTEEEKIEVGLNPVKVETYKSNFYVLCMGNYFDIKGCIKEVKKVNGKYEVTELFEATKMSMNNKIIYAMNHPYTNDPVPVTFLTYDVDKKVKSDLNLTNLEDPVNIGVNPKTGNIFVSSYPIFHDYSKACYVNEYKSNGTLVKRYDAGVGADSFVF